MLSVAVNLRTCHGCDFRQQPPFADNVCHCTVDGLPIAAHAAAGNCPKGLHIQPHNEKPGTELAAIFEGFGIVHEGECNCKMTAERMDQMGCDWCEEHIECLVESMRVEAMERGIGFVAIAAKSAIRLAIGRARKAASKGSA